MAIALYNGKFILLVSVSFITIFSSIAIYFCLPILISHVIRSQITLSPSSGSFNDWRLNYVTDRIYLYNITNQDDILEQSERIASSNPIQPNVNVVPRLEEVGPFTYIQKREKFNIRFDQTNETVLYDQKKSWQFAPELSIVKSEAELESLVINHMNVPLAGTTLNPIFAEAINPTVLEYGMKLFSKHTARELLFEGYPDILMEQAKASGQVDVDRFGWMFNLNNSVTSNVRVYTGPSNATLGKFGSMDQYKFKNNLAIWQGQDEPPETTRCNQFKYSSAGEFFPPPVQSIISHNNQWQRQQVINDRNKFSDISNTDTSDKTPMSGPSHSMKASDDSTINDGNKHLTGQDNHIDNSDSLWNDDKSDKFISLFMPDLCRTYELYYNKTYDFEGLTVDRYIANELTYNYNSRPTRRQLLQYTMYLNQTIKIASDLSRSTSGGHNQQVSENSLNKCFCVYNEFTNSSSCPPNGLLDLYSCRKGSPIMISFPHFLYSRNDPSMKPYLELIQDQTEPNIEEHQFYFDLESSLNVPVQAQVVLQFNIRFRNDPNLNFTINFPFLFEKLKQRQQSSPDQPHDAFGQDLYMPQMWIQSRARIDAVNLRNLKFLKDNLKLVTPIVTVVMFAFASVLLAASAKMAYDLSYAPKSRKCSIDQADDQDGERANMLSTGIKCHNNGNNSGLSSGSANHSNDSGENNNYELTNFVSSK